MATFFQVDIAPAEAHDVPAAWEVLFGNQLARPAEEYLSESATPSGLYVAKRGADVVGAGWVRAESIEQNSLVLPKVASGESHGVAQQILHRLAAFVKLSRNSTLVCLPNQSENDLWQSELFGLGLEQITSLRFLVCLEAWFPIAEPTVACGMMEVSDQDFPELKRVVDATVVQSLDCPALRDVRGVEAALPLDGLGEEVEAYLCLIEFQPIGCLVLEKVNHGTTLEIRYVGLVPDWRGQGIGSRLVAWTLWRARQLNCNQVLTIVDGANEPAVQLYSQAGFTVYEERSLYFLDPRLSRDVVNPC